MVENHLALEVALFCGSWCLIDQFWVGFSGSGTGWGIRFMGTGLVHPLLEQKEQCSVIMQGRAVTIQVLHKELTNFVNGH